METAPPPVEPPEVRDVFQGLRVRPKTSLKVLPPAPNSGVFDLPMTMPPLRSIRADAGNIGEVLDRDGQSSEPTGLVGGFTGGAALYDAFGMVARAIEAQGRQRIHRRLDLGDAAGR